MTRSHPHRFPRLSRSIAAFIVLFVLVHFTGLRAVEPWADERLPVRDSVALWLDAGQQNTARSTVKLPGLMERNPLDYLLDGSGHGRHLFQGRPESRPRYRQDANGAFLVFDGQDDALTASRLRAQMTNATLFVVLCPRSNAGFFRGFCAFTRAGGNDYTTGTCFGYGAGPTAQLSYLNAEGAGFGGATQLQQGPPLLFGAWHLLNLGIYQGPAGVQLRLDGQDHGARDRQPSLLGLDEFVLGARHYSNTGEPPFTQGFFHGEIAEFLMFDRILSAAERKSVEQYLQTKHARLLSLAPQLTDNSKPFITVTNPPAVQMLVPGFTARELPVKLSNINNVKYREDGKLVAVGYDGNIHLLSDSDGDGLEDRVEPFWSSNTLRSPIGMALTPPGYALGQGVFVAGKGKVSLIVDKNGDGRADEEIIVADKWPELRHNVDALSVAIDREGNIYFGLGTANFTDAYLIDKTTGQARYDLKSERGTIIKVSADFKHREILCTGIRFPIALAFNQAGDLFCTDQEGATWLPNGNPFDELLHIQAGRHYGFPPRHPKHLPGVIDEPSVYDYLPQHQSTCGLNFNEPVNGGPVFGPDAWRGDALVCGYSRGKLWRTQLVPTAAGYVAQSQLIASLPALVIDACVSPGGALLVATHGGEPDWGSGPNGQGHLYKLAYTGRETPQPVLAWANSATEIHVAFDRPLDPASLKDLAKRVDITQGEFAGAGDRFETKRPGYAVVYNQMSAPRHDVPVQSASLSPDRRALILGVKPLSVPVNYAITLNGIFAPETNVPGAIVQQPAVDLVADLAGLEARWSSHPGPAIVGVPASWNGWLPHLDLAVAEKLTRGSSSHDLFWHRLREPGELVLQCQLKLDHLLQPVVQPGSQLDYEPPVEEAILAFSALIPFRFISGNLTTNSAPAADGGHQVTVRPNTAKSKRLSFSIILQTGLGEPRLTANWRTTEDPRPRAFPTRRFMLPWAELEATTVSSAPTNRVIPQLIGGDWARGKKVFFSETAACYKCHTVRGAGAHVGPDLSNLVHRDYASVLKDIREPNAALNPDHLGYSIQMTDGEEITAVLQSETRDQITVASLNGSTVIPRNKIKSIKPSALSLMPESLDQALGPAQMADLMTFLLTSPLEPAPLETPGEPPPRKLAEFQAALKAGATTEPTKTSQLFEIVLCAGPKDHGPGEHDYPLWQKRWSRLLVLAENVRVGTAWEWPSPGQWKTARVIVFYSNLPGWNSTRAAELEAFLQRGGGAVFLHYAVDGHDEVDQLAKLIGLAWKGGHSKFRHGPLDLKLEPGPLTAGLTRTSFVDESYWNLIGQMKDSKLVASGIEEGQTQPLMWTRQHGQGRVFVSIPGHYNWTFDDPLFRLLLLRGICWAGDQPTDRLSELSLIGARVSE